MPIQDFTVTVIGGGNGAFAAAAHLSQKGLKVNLCDPYNHGEIIAPLLERPLLKYVGFLGEGTVTLHKVTPNIEEAIKKTDLILVCVPSTAHSTVAGWLAPVLKNGTSILLNPGHTGGALNFLHALRAGGFAGKTILGETNTLTYIARKIDSTTVNITNVAGNVYIAALPGCDLNALLERTAFCYPDLKACRNVMGTSLRNLNAIMHTPAMILAAAWIESTQGDFTFYFDAATPAVERLMQAIDNERIAIGAAWGENLEPLIDMLAAIGTTTHEAKESGSLLRAFRESKPNRAIKAPPSLDHRYMHEDFGFGLAPMVTLAGLAGVDVPMMRALVSIASNINQKDYLQEGLNLMSMGLDAMNFKQAMRWVSEGGSSQ